MRIGVLGIQGSVVEHATALRRLLGKGNVAIVKRPEDLKGLDGLIIPGGESTTITLLMRKYAIDKAIAEEEPCIMGTCAGAILLAKEIEGMDQFSLKLMDVKIERNAYGRQVDSFETDLEIPAVGGKVFRAIFIRAPVIKGVGKKAEVLASLNGEPVMVRQGKHLALTFHPELTDDARVHQYFLRMIKEEN